MRPITAKVVAALAVAAAATPAPSRAQDVDKDAAWRAELDRAFDRFSDVDGDRLEKALAIVERRVRERPEDFAARLELARIKIVREDFDAGLLESSKASASGEETQKKQGEAIHLLAVYLGGKARVDRAQDEAAQKKASEDFKNGVQAAQKKLVAAAGTEDAAKTLFRQELERNEFLKALAEIGKPPRAIGKPDLDDKAIDLAADYTGKVVLVDFWATWCGPCLAEMPNVVKLYADYHGRGLEIVGVSLDEKRDLVDRVTKDKSMSWRQHFDGKGWHNEVAVAWGVQAIPRTYLIDHEGKVRYLNARGEGLAAAIKLLVERAEAANKKKGS